MTVKMLRQCTMYSVQFVECVHYTLLISLGPSGPAALSPENILKGLIAPITNLHLINNLQAVSNTRNNRLFDNFRVKLCLTL